MISVEREVDRYLTLLRNKIRERGFIQMEVQDALGWGRSYISQLLTKQKALRLEQVLLVLNVIGVAPETFFSELYVDSLNTGAATHHGMTSQRIKPQGAPIATRESHEIERLTSLVKGLIKLLADRELITAAGLSEAVKAARLEHYP